MMFRKFTPTLLILALALSACSFQINIPVDKTGPTTTDEINLPLPDASNLSLTLNFGAGKLILNPGAQGLVNGTAMYNIPDFKPIISTNDGEVSIKQGNYQLHGIPDVNNIKNEWDFKLGSAAMDLTIEAGAYQAEYEFGGLALSNLTVKDGASDVKLRFSEPNLTEMNTFRYETGASNVSLKNLANANFAMLKFSSGAGNYTLDFSGTLKRPASVDISSGVSNFTLVIPNGLPVQITLEESLANVTVPDGWTHSGNIYTQPGEGPELTIIINIGAGNLTITH